MERYIIKVLAILIVLLPVVQACDPKPVDPNPNVNQNDTFRTPYVEDQLIVIYKNPPTTGQPKIIEKAIKDTIPDAKLKRTCSECDLYTELWEGKDMHTILHAKGIVSGTRPRATLAGEDSLAYYSLNFKMHLPYDSTLITRDILKSYFSLSQPDPTIKEKDNIVIAVIDNGIDTDFINNSFLWTNMPGAGSDCYAEGIQGWNFINESPPILDENTNLHGTLVSRYIINQFVYSPNNFPQIMNLKTFSPDGKGTLFHNICAIHFAIQNGANIINASWGLYYYEDEVHPYLSHLITKVLKDKNILFLTASGNKLDDVDLLAVEEMGIPEGSLRDLEIHHFYPAYLSDDSNHVYTVTTTNKIRISRSQNYSNRHVDLGVVCDKETPDLMQFKFPFIDIDAYISGSSFATAIATGKIGAFFPKSSYSRVRLITKNDLVDELRRIEGITATGIIYESTPLWAYIREGRYVFNE